MIFNQIKDKNNILKKFNRYSLNKLKKIKINIKIK